MTDHKAEAESLISLAGYGEGSDPGTAATAHAVLYLAEQQRIANLIAIAVRNADLLREGIYRSHDGAPVNAEDKRAEVDGWFRQVREGLGLA